MPNTRRMRTVPTLSVGDWTGGRYPFTVPGLAWFGEGRSCNVA